MTWFEDHPKPLVEHLAELRGRLVWCVGTFGCVALTLLVLPSLDHSLSIQILAELRAHLTPPGVTLIFLDPMEPLNAVMKIALVVSLLVTAPVFTYHLFGFLAPALDASWRGLAVWMAVGTMGLMVLGATVAYTVVIPTTLRLLIEFGVAAGALPQLSVGRFVGTVGWMLLLFSVPFELPLVIGALARLGVVSVEQLGRVRKYAYLGILTASAVITPDPSIVSMSVLSVMLCALYEAGVMFARAVAPRSTSDDVQQPVGMIGA